MWVKSGSRAELQFDDGSTLRLGGGAVATLHTMYSDDRGEFTEVKLNDGLATFHLRSKLSEYQIDTPLSSVKASGPAEIRVGVGSLVEVACTGGTAEVLGKQGQAALRPQERLEIHDQVAPYQVTEIPSSDQWDRFNWNRDVTYRHHNNHVPPNIDLVAGNLDTYGTWHNDPRHGYVWVPRVYETGWRPYHNGHWVWVSPWGWTWVGDEAWGYAPYHYGAWAHESYGWAWCPGPAVQYWSPAVVDYVDNGNYVGWAPLAPGEVVYPAAINIGFRSGNWWLNFSIGGAAAYYPTGPTRCEARPWDNVYANREVNVYNVTNITNIYNSAGPGTNGVFVRNSRFIPENGSRFAGMTTATRTAFIGSGAFQAPRADPRGTAFRNGRSFAGTPTNAQVFGPPTVRPSRTSFAPTRTFVHAGIPPQTILQRSVVRRGVPSAIASNSPPIRGALAPSTLRAPVVRAASLNRVQRPVAAGVKPRVPARTSPNVIAAKRTQVPTTQTRLVRRPVVAPSNPRTVSTPTVRTTPIPRGNPQKAVRPSQPRVVTRPSAPVRQPQQRIATRPSAPVRQPQQSRPAQPQAPVRNWHVTERRAPTQAAPQRTPPKQAVARSRPQSTGNPPKQNGGNGKAKRGG
ncbi:MAG TPA: DUF6600 domain-containing protein [Fimbriimonadaceae bacterium]|nr:DUF6600 domain-containing protein [Fimbriimonadaceae bacterium]